MSNIELRGNTWFATLHVPADVRGVIGKAKLIKTLKTSDKRLARERSLPIVAEWKAAIREARGSTDSFTSDALRWKRAVESAEDGHQKESIELQVVDRAEHLEATKGHTTAKAFADIALGYKTPIEPLVGSWEASIAGLAPKTKALYVPTVKKMAARFKTLESINKKSVRAWILELSETLSGATIQRTMGACQNFWGYLQARDMVDIDAAPFRGHKIKVKSDPYVPFKPAEVVTLWNMAKGRGDQPLADLIQLGAYTGSRISELCSLKVGDVVDDYFKVVDAKTTAGIREVPIHSNISGLIKRLKEDSKDGYMIPSTADNKRGERSDPLSKAFGRLKGELGYKGDRTHTFHSIRKTTVTMLENAGVPEGVTADIVGHEKPSITYGLYSGGNSLEVKREALERISYPGM